jgi:hypothetical protein
MRTILIILLFVCPVSTGAQVLDKPNVGLSSHEYIELDRIEFTGGRTLLYLTIENKRLAGRFCISEDTWLKNSLGDSEYRLIESANIPVCPETYRFRSIGEKRSFVLHFPQADEPVRYFDLVEHCEDDCLTMKYICLDPEINRRINEGLDLYAAGRPDQALAHFEGILADRNDNYSPVFGTLYLYLMMVSFDMGSSKDLRYWYDELKSSSVVNREEILEVIKEEGLVR